MKTQKLLKFLMLATVMLGLSCADDESKPVTGICPLVISTIPVDGATEVPLDQIISATFNKTMDVSTINASSFTITGTLPVQGVLTFENSGQETRAIFTPTAPLEEETTYTGRISTTVKDLDGNALQVNYVWSFSTGSILAPTVLATDPVDTATDVEREKVITATFSEVMDPATINAATFTINDGNANIAGTFAFNGAMVSFTPAVDLVANTVYTGTITTGAQNMDGTPLESNYVWTFTTETLLPPTVISTDPADAAVDVALNKTVSVTFSETMDPLTINGTTFKIMNGAIQVAGTFGFNGAVVTFNPTLDLAPGTTYEGTITTGAENMEGTPMTSNYVWSFTTIALPAPTVLSTDPADNETNVALNKTISVTFSETMQQATINPVSFKIMNGAIQVAGTFGFNGAVVTFDPTVDLDPGTTYEGTITTAAQNMAGTGLANNYVWQFQTVAPVPNLPDLGTVEMFGAFGGSAGLTNQGLFTVINNGGIGTTAVSTAVTGFHDGLTGDIYTETTLNVGLVTGGIYTAPPPPGTATSFAIAQQGLLDAIALYAEISPASMPGGSDPGAGELGGLTLPPGIYKSAGATFNIFNGDLTLDGQGDPNALWVFQCAGGLTVGIAGPTGAKSVILINGASAANVFWHVGSAATINGAGGGVMVGTIVANSAVTFSTAGNVVQTVLNGRAISLVGSVTMVNTTINVPN